MIHERINLYELPDNHINIEIDVDYNEEVSVQCNNPHSGAVCSVYSATLPSGAFHLLASKDFKACGLKLQSTSGEDRRTGTELAHIPSGGTVLEANFSDAQNSAEHFAMLRNQLAALTNMPMGNTTTDINTSKPTRSVAGVGYVQSFPTLAARPGSWGSLQRQLLPFQGQVGALQLLDAQAFRSAALWHAWTYTLHATPVSDYSASETTQNSYTDEYICNSSRCGMDVSRNGTYRIAMTLRIELTVPQTLTPFLSNCAVNIAQISNAKEGSLLESLRLYSIQTMSSNSTTTTGTNSTTNSSKGKSLLQSFALHYYSRDTGNGQEFALHNESAAAHSTGAYCSNSTPSAAEEGFGECAASTAAATGTAGAPKESVVHCSRISDAAVREAEVHRRIFDSRTDVFSTLTTIKLPETHPARGGCWFTEVLPEHYSIDFTQYTYEIMPVVRNSSSCSSGNSSGTVAVQLRGSVTALSNVHWTTADCAVHDIGAATNRNLEEAPINWYMHAIDMFMGNPRVYDANAVIQRLDEGVVSPAEHRCFRSLSFELPALPQNSFLVLAYQGNKRWVSREHQPIGASTGAQVPPSYLTYSGSSSSGSVYTGSFLLTTALPDASMPFNVLTLVSTLLAFFLGSLLNAVLKNRSKPVTPSRERELR